MKMYQFEVKFSDDPLSQFHCQWTNANNDAEALKLADEMLADDPGISFMRVSDFGDSRVLREGDVTREVTTVVNWNPK